MNDTYPGYSEYIKQKKDKEDKKVPMLILLAVLAYSAINILPTAIIAAGGYGMLAIIGMTAVSCIFYRPEKLIYYLKIFFPFMIIIALYIFYHYFVDGIVSGTLLYTYQISILFMAVIPGYTIVNLKSEKSIKILFYCIAGMVLLTALTTAVGLLANEGASRYLASASVDASEFNTYMWENIGGYDFIYTAVLIFPMIIALFKQKIINIFVAGIITVVMATMVIRSEYATALLFFIFSMVLFFLKRKLTLKFVVVFLLVVMVLMLMFSGPLADQFERLSETVSSETLSDRFSSMAGELRGQQAEEDTDFYARESFYKASFESFLKNPVTGGMFSHGTRVGGHSFILDFLAFFGLIGGAALTFAYVMIFKKMYLPFSNQPFFGYMVWSFILCIILSFVNTGMWIFCLTLIIPLVASYMKIKLQSKEMVEDSEE